MSLLQRLGTWRISETVNIPMRPQVIHDSSNLVRRRKVIIIHQKSESRSATTSIEAAKSLSNKKITITIAQEREIKKN